jgi:hypothetical protein
VARVGNHPDAFFVGPETPNDRGVEIAADGAETPVGKYKEAGRIKRQVARFRVFEYEKNPATGLMTLKREITSKEAKIEWRVDLVNRKAALDRTVDRGIDPQVAPRPRNTGITGAARAGLIIRGLSDPVPAISGENAPALTLDQGKFLGKGVYLGELRTDQMGRLLVFGGRGNSASVPPNKPLLDFANNDLWHDDAADGPVTATMTLHGQPARAVDAPAWVTIAPPDFAPGIGGIVTLYDVAYQAAIDAGFVKPATKPSFRRHIMPVIQSAANLRFVNEFAFWNTLRRDFPNLTKTEATAAPGRQQVFDVLMPPNIADTVNNAVVPAFLKRYFDQYLAGDFSNDLTDPLPPTTIPDDLDRAALEACIGLSFFPGIEASLNLRHKDMYSESFRFNHTSAEVFAGFLTEIMAVPWQADFLLCRADPLAWWPSQRPDIVMQDGANIPGSQALWAEGIGKFEDMVEKFGTLAVVVPKTVGGQTVFVQEGP